MTGNSTVEKKRNALAHKLYKATKPKGTAPPVTYCNANTIGRLEAIIMPSPRADANQHMQHASRGLGAQIVRPV